MTKTSGRVPVVNNYATGEVRYRGFRLDGTMHGYWKFYRKDGSVMRTGEFNRGGRVEVWRTFDRAGRVVKVTDYPKR